MSIDNISEIINRKANTRQAVEARQKFSGTVKNPEHKRVSPNTYRARRLGLGILMIIGTGLAGYKTGEYLKNVQEYNSVPHLKYSGSQTYPVEKYSTPLDAVEVIKGHEHVDSYDVVDYIQDTNPDAFTEDGALLEGAFLDLPVDVKPE